MGGVSESSIIGDVRENPRNYDLMEIISVCISKKPENATEGAIRLLSSVFTAELSTQKKKEILAQEYDIQMSEKEVGEMEGLYIGYIKHGELKGTIKTCRDLGQSIADTIAYLVKRFSITQADAEEATKEYWNS